MPLRWCLLLLAASLTGCGRTSPGEPIFIGYLAPLQATDKTQFEHARQGMSLAIEELGRPQGAVLGRQFVVLNVDAGEDLEQLQASAVRLLTVNRAVALIGGQDAAHVERLTRAAQPYEAPLISPALIAPYLAAENLFSLEPSPARAAKAIGRWLKDTVKTENLAFVYDRGSQVAAELGTSLRAELQRGEVGRLIDAPYSPPAKSGEICETIRQSKAGAWLFFGKQQDWNELRKAMREAKLKLPCLITDGAGTIDSLASAPDLDGPLFQLTVYFPQEQDKSTTAFQASYAKRFHADPDIYAGLGYDAVRLIADASSSGKTNAAGRLAVDLTTFIKNPFASCTGPLYFDQPDHSANRTLFLIQKTDKQPRLVFKQEAAQ
jgi:ABC-type branched-subunit amino acid transport system substrate-binding protein